MTAAHRTPDDLAIRPRDMAFGRNAARERWWLGGDPVGTAFYDALSVTFPQGERFFMDAVRRFRDQAPPRLQAQIAGFLTQEALHTREHLLFNKQVGEQGYDVTGMEARTRARLDYARTRTPLEQLAATAALEHFTAILAHALLADPRHLEGAPAEAKALWRWHALEEIEHKAVAFDTLTLATRAMSPLARWAMRCSVMVAATSLLITTVGSNIADSFTADGLNNRRGWLALARFLLVRPGMIRQVLGLYLLYFLPGFHPWDHDDRHLARSVEQSLEAYGASVAA